MECFFTFQLLSQYAGDSYIIHPKINPEAGFVDDTYLRRSVAQTIHIMRVSDIKILENKAVISVMSLIKQIKPTKHMTLLCFQIYNKESKL